jgi:hypothetical protein
MLRSEQLCQIPNFFHFDWNPGTTFPNVSFVSIKYKLTVREQMHWLAHVTLLLVWHEHNSVVLSLHTMKMCELITYSTCMELKESVYGLITVYVVNMKADESEKKEKKES